MNVGSILNNDSPPSDHEREASPTAPLPFLQPAPPPPQSNSARSSVSSASGSRPSMASVHQRHSITNMLNDTPAVPTVKEEPHTTTLETTPRLSSKPPPAIKRNSIADITNENDIDISTGAILENKSKIKQVEKSNEIDKVKSEQTTTTTPPVKEKSDTSIIEEEDDDLSKIKKKLSSMKPKRYETPPIWAQQWIPPNQQGERAQLEETEPTNGNLQPHAKLSDKHVFDYTTTRSVDLQCSITGVIPPASVTRTIAEWIYANFSNIEDRNRKYVELELKFGKIIDKRTGNRLNVNVVTECIFTDHSNIRYDMQVEEIAWQEVRKFFEELERNYQEDHKGAHKQAGPRRKFNMLESDQTDSFYQIGGKGEHIKKVRVSKDNEISPPRYVAIHKERIADLYIHNPSSMYDLRLSLSLEIPVPENNIEPIITKNKPSLVREKKRTTWTHAPTITQFDLTRVLIPLESKNKQGKKIVTHDISYEIELEIDTLEVFNAIDKITQGIDNFRLEELVEVFVNNARVINNRVTKLALP
ncbi:mRNA-capping enzyme subunit beta [Spathaspora sp. JA1]|nr:mRNA-capping enzyme subunit beta [Spathaspora sp. JA1]